MEQLNGKTAIISGGGEGIGFALAKTFGGLGMNIVITDIEKTALDRAAAELADAGVPVLAIEMDVALREDWQRTADLAQEKFGNIHMLVNNAGVGGAMGALGNLDEPGWRWAIDVNLMGVVFGADTLVPLMQAHGEPCWLINVASMAGMAGVPLAGSYTATKAAVVALTEAWSLELAGSNIAVSVLAPAFVKTRIHQSHRNRQPRYAPTVAPGPEVMEMAKGSSKAVENGIDPSMLCERVLEALAAGETYIFTHPLYRSVTDARSAAIARAFDSAASSPVVKDVSEQPMSGGFKEK
jgi:NAD(P)-dependent dehydrogenase (short-subunit alcohol dehydrogenase family)